jgi:hypothetical protein
MSMAQWGVESLAKDATRASLAGTFSAVYINLTPFRQPGQTAWMYKGIITPVSKHHIMNCTPNNKTKAT